MRATHPPLLAAAPQLLAGDTEPLGFCLFGSCSKGPESFGEMACPTLWSLVCRARCSGSLLLE